MTRLSKIFAPLLASLLLLQALTPLPSAADDVNTGSDIDKIEDLTQDIVQKQSELIRLSTMFRINGTRVSPAKIWRLFFYNFAASSTCDAGAISTAYTRWNNYHHPIKLTPRSAAVGPLLLTIGHSIVLAGVMLETVLDKLSDAKLRKQGLDLKTTHDKVLSIRSNLNSLLEERQKLIAAARADNSYLITAKVEQDVLRDIEGMVLKDYALFFVRAKKFYANRTTSAFLTGASAASGEFAGTIPGLISSSERKPRAVETAGIGFPISGGLIVLTPILSRLVANASGKLASIDLNKELPESISMNLEILNRDKEKLRKCISENKQLADSSMVARRLEAYEKESRLFQFQKEMNETENRIANRELKERMFFASLIGGSKISWGVNLANAGFGFRDDKRKLFTQRTAIGATTYIPGNSLWVLDTLQSHIRLERREHKLAQNKKRPGDLLNERMDRLDEIDAVFNY